MKVISETKLREIIGQAVGEASMCWAESPTGTFDATRAGAIVNNLMDTIKGHVVICDEVPEPMQETFQGLIDSIIGKIKEADAKSHVRVPMSREDIDRQSQAFAEVGICEQGPPPAMRYVTPCPCGCGRDVRLEVLATDCTGFPEALTWIKHQQHLLMFRTGWNGSGMWVVHMPPSTNSFGVHQRAHLLMRTADGSMVPWVASQTDLLADDWVVFDYKTDKVITLAEEAL